ncbi:dTDP-4-dehydrorhamnose reductase [Flagellimonas sp.]|uniref:dTDP-4-dehydrorhamnose reductase n=1 Tax=Flagellimonas sp. TaxID=2058762 RepID=UPI003B5CE875
MKNVLVTGGKGQLGNCIKDVAKGLDNCNFIYVDVDELDITEAIAVNQFFKDKKITHCINCAAYTAVDNAESNQKLAEKINVEGAKNLAEACSHNGAILIHISTDFVFDGNQTNLYTEKDKENPLGVYGLTKLYGEREVIKALKEHFIVRTSWLYSEYGNNFLKTMLKLGAQRETLSVVCDQIGTPTYAGDLAKLVINIVQEDKSEYGTYHYSNEGVTSWYDFAKAIFDESDTNVILSPIKSEAYPTPAERPRFSVMDKSKIKEELKLEIPYWRDSLKRCLLKLDK